MTRASGQLSAVPEVVEMIEACEQRLGAAVVSPRGADGRKPPTHAAFLIGRLFEMLRQRVCQALVQQGWQRLQPMVRSARCRSTDRPIYFNGLR